jgi:hypothetical protein
MVKLSYLILIVGYVTIFYDSFISTDFICYVANVYMIVCIIDPSYLLISLLVCGLQRIINSESEFVPGMKDPWQFDHKNLADRLHETLPQENGMKDCKVVSSFFYTAV